VIPLLTKYETRAVRTMRIRIENIQMIRIADIRGVVANARARKATKATPVTPYVSNPSAVGPTLSPALSPVQSAMTPGFLGSSSGRWKTIFIRSEPISAIFVKTPPAILSAEAPRDSPIAKPIKLGPTRSFGRNTRIQIMKKSSTLIRRSPTLIPEVRGMLTTSTGFPRRDEKAVLEFAHVLMRMPNHATP